MTGSLKRGWCPGALRPMQSGDGLILRVRPRAGALTLDAMSDIAQGALQFGNGIVDLTRRANVQVRGLREETLSGMHDILRQHDLLDETQAGEQVRNIMLSPLSGTDSSELFDVHPIARALEKRLATDDRLWRLPAKFGFILESGARPGLENERADIRLVAFQNQQGRCGFKVGLDRPQAIAWIGETFESDAEQLVSILTNIALAVISNASDGTKQVPRIRNLSSEQFLRVEKTARSDLQIINERETPVSQKASGSNETCSRPLGLLELGHDRSVLALALPFGSLSAQSWLTLIKAAKSSGISELRLSPWRTIYLPLPSKSCAAPLLKTADRAGFISDPENPILKIDACPGAPACASAMSNTRDDARAIALNLAAIGNLNSIHVSGCAKGCARSKPADIVLVAQPNGYGLARNANASQTPETLIPFDRVTHLDDGLEPLIAPSPGSLPIRNIIRA